MNNVMTKLWTDAGAELKLQLTADVWEMYVRPLTPLALDDNTLTLAAPNQYVADWLTNRLDKTIRRTLAAIAGHPVAAVYLVAPGNQLPLTAAASTDASIVIAGQLREPGYVRLWHDLRNLYGPLLGLSGIALWAELRASINTSASHPLTGYGWLSMRSLESCYADGRMAITAAAAALRAAHLLEWRTGAELIALWHTDRAAGVPDARNRGVAPAILNRLIANPTRTRLYVVHDPLDLPQFCTRFGQRLVMHAGSFYFDAYAGRISPRWNDWLLDIALAQKRDAFPPEFWSQIGLASVPPAPSSAHSNKE